MNHIRPSQPTSPKQDSAILTPVYWSSLFLWSVSEPTFFPVKVQIHFPCTSSLKQEALRLSGLHPGLPAREQSAEVLWVHGLLDEQVDLPPHAEHRPLLHPLQLLLQPQQHPRRHFVEALAVTAGARAKGDETGLRQRLLFNINSKLIFDVYLDLRRLSMSSPPIVEPSVALSSCCSSCCR